MNSFVTQGIKTKKHKWLKNRKLKKGDERDDIKGMFVCIIYIGYLGQMSCNIELLMMRGVKWE